MLTKVRSATVVLEIPYILQHRQESWMGAPPVFDDVAPGFHRLIAVPLVQERKLALSGVEILNVAQTIGAEGKLQHALWLMRHLADGKISLPESLESECLLLFPGTVCQDTLKTQTIPYVHRLVNGTVQLDWYSLRIVTGNTYIVCTEIVLIK